SEGVVKLTTMFVLVFTAVLLFTLSAVGAVTDRWADTTDAPPVDGTGTTVPAGRTTPPAERAGRRDTALARGRQRGAGLGLADHDRPNLVLLDSSAIPYSAAFEACRRDHPASASAAPQPHRAGAIGRHAPNPVVPLRRETPSPRRSA
ncbi:MAG: hypothetical protein ACHQNA_02995, partial [Acidimicrobiales bacterium]